MKRWPQDFRAPPRSAWYSWRIKPVRVGWYEIRYGRENGIYPADPDGLRYWDGRAWLFGPGEGQCLMGDHEADAWRGVASEAGR